MTENEFQDDLARSLSNIKKHWDNQSVLIAADERQQIDVALKQLSLFSQATRPADCERMIGALQNIIKSLSVVIESEAHELQAETNGGQLFTPDELERINEYAYRRELVQFLQHALSTIYEIRPEFKPK